MRRSWLISLGMVPIGATGGRRYLELTSEALEVRFGWAWRHWFPLKEIKQVALVAAPSRYSPRWKGDLFHAFYPMWVYYADGVINFVYSQDNVVEIRLREPQRVRFLLPRVSCRAFAASLEDPEAFLTAIARYGVETVRESAGAPGGTP